MSETQTKKGAALGANLDIRCGISVGEWAMVGAGSVVTKDVPAHGLVYGNPAKLHGFVCPCGTELVEEGRKEGALMAKCPKCSSRVEISVTEWERAR